LSGFFVHRTPFWIPWLLPKFVWHGNSKGKNIYLTFDDGPVPAATLKVLDWLKQYQAKATFFCVGENVQRYPSVVEKVIAEGHALGNHTFRHLNGWDTNGADYLEDVARCQEVLAPYASNSSKPLMRPPYGRLTPTQWRPLVKEYQVIMWDVLSGDFSAKIDSQQCLEKSIQYTKPGSIVLFHDSVKTVEKLSLVLPRFLEHFTGLGYTFRTLAG